VPELSPIFWCV